MSVKYDVELVQMNPVVLIHPSYLIYLLENTCPGESDKGNCLTLVV